MVAADHRITRTRRHAYRTRSNRVKTIKTPGALRRKMQFFVGMFQ